VAGLDRIFLSPDFGPLTPDLSSFSRLPTNHLFFAFYLPYTFVTKPHKRPSNYAAKKKQVHAPFSNANTFHAQVAGD
jgi:hypothetical protein